MATEPGNAATDRASRIQPSLLQFTEESGEEPGSSEHSAPLGGLTSARLLVRAGLSELRLRAGRAPADLYRAQFQGATPQVRLRDGRVLVQYRGTSFDWHKRKATLALNARIPWTIEIVGHIERVEVDLRDIELQAFALTGGAEQIQLELGQPRGDVPIEATGGARTIRLERPRGVPLRISVAGGAGRVELDGRSQGAKGGIWSSESDGWSGSRDRFSVSVRGGVQSIEVVAR